MAFFEGALLLIVVVALIDLLLIRLWRTRDTREQDRAFWADRARARRLAQDEARRRAQQQEPSNAP